MVGELDGVADEVDRDLAQTAGIALDATRYGVVDVDGQRQALFACLCAEQFDDFAQCPSRIEFAADEIEASGLDLRQVEDVVQQVEQVLARPVKRFSS